MSPRDQITSTQMTLTRPDRSYIPRLARRLEEVAEMANRYAEARGNEESVDDVPEAA